MQVKFPVLLFPSRRFEVKKKMAVEKRLAFSIVQFLRDQTHGGALNSDEQESLEGGSAMLTEGSLSLTRLGGVFFSFGNNLACCACALLHRLSHAQSWPSKSTMWFLSLTMQLPYSVWRQPLKSVPATAILPCLSLWRRYSSTPSWRWVKVLINDLPVMSVPPL